MQSLDGKRILIAEDDPLIAMLLTEIVEGLKGEVVKTVASIEDASARLKSDSLDLLILDYFLGRRTGDTLVEQAQMQGIPVLLSTGASPDEISARLSAIPVLSKPWSAQEAERAILRAMAAPTDTDVPSERSSSTRT